MNYKIAKLPVPPTDIQLLCKTHIAKAEPFCKLAYGDPTFANSKWDIRPQDYPDGHLGFRKTEELCDYINSRHGGHVTFSIYTSPNEVKDWCYKNIQPLLANEFKINSIEIAAMTGGTAAYPHVDPAQYVLNFMIELGSEHASTQFWKVNDEFKHLPTYIANIYPYEKLDLVDTVVVPPSSWVFLKVSELHSVENLDPTQVRIILQIDVSPI